MRIEPEHIVSRMRTLLARIIIQLSSSLFLLLKKTDLFFVKNDDVLICSPSITPKQLNEIKKRLSFYAPALSARQLLISNRLTFRYIFSDMVILLFSGQESNSCWIFLLLRMRKWTYDIDFRTNHMDGWRWCALAQDFSPPPPSALQRFHACVSDLKKLALQKCYIFGTGPSLEEAGGRDWSDGYRVVCNTIVRDKALWNHIKPHFIVAGDAIYHFGHTEFARRFRADLIKRLQETDTYFVYPAQFHAIVGRDLHQFANRLIPIPIGSHHRMHIDLTKTFQLPQLGNVLRLLLLPLGCTLSKNVYLWGFDGRAPDDKLFWSNSDKHSYPELMPTLCEAHPAFFSYYVPKAKPDSYVAYFHGDALDKSMLDAEHDGYAFIMMHKSWTQTLQKRFTEE